MLKNPINAITPAANITIGTMICFFSVPTLLPSIFLIIVIIYIVPIRKEYPKQCKTVLNCFVTDYFKKCAGNAKTEYLALKELTKHLLNNEIGFFIFSSRVL